MKKIGNKDNYTNSAFENIKNIDEYGQEYWLARDLQKVLEYKDWRNFQRVIDKAVISAKNSVSDKEDWVVEVNKPIKTGKGKEEFIKDYKLSIYICYLIVQNADPSKEVVALGQTYFAIQTRKQEITEQEYDSLSDDEKRFYQRKLTKQGNYTLQKVASSAGVKNMAEFHNAGYVRLSREDKIKDESNSITNQKAIINSYIKNNNEFKLIDFYIDYGYSGTTFDRPGFKEMIKDITDDKVNTIIVKDLSRFGRNHIESDNYIENFLPGYNVRIISINDNIDTLKSPKSSTYIEIPLRNLMNDCYARDISEKVKSTLKVKQQNGIFIGTFAPYGYLKDPKDKHKLIIDIESANIVRKIFDMILLDKSRKEIADFLNDNNILTPSLYKINKEKTNNQKLVLSKKWNAEIVNRILRNETYTGTLIQNIKTKPNYKNSKLIDVNKEDWIKTENHHDALISIDKFDEVQQILDRKIKVNKNNQIDLFSGYLKCFHCCEHLIIRKSKSQVYYYCSSYIKNKSCVKYSMNKKNLEKLVIEELNSSLSLELDNLNRKVLIKYINMIYVSDKDNIKIEFKNNEGDKNE